MRFITLHLNALVARPCLGSVPRVFHARCYAVASTSTYKKTPYTKKPVSAASYSKSTTASSSSPATAPSASSSKSPSTSTSPPAESSPVASAESSTLGGSVQPPTAIGITTNAINFQDGDANAVGQSNVSSVDWYNSYHGLGLEPFPKEVGAILTMPLDAEEIEIKPDGLIYLPEIKYRRILNKAFGPGGWGLAPRSETIITPKMVTREYALICQGRLVAVARGEQDYFDPSGIPTATEGCKSNAMMRCCKDLGVASELWDPRFIRTFKKKHAQQLFVEHVTTKKKKSIWLRKDDEVSYPFKKC